MPLKITSWVAPRLEIPPQTCTFNGCLTRSSAGVSLETIFPAASRTILVITNWWFGPNCTELSSVNMTLLNVSSVDFNSRQNASRLTLFCSRIKGWFTGLDAMNPSCFRWRRMHDEETSRPNSCLTSIFRSFDVALLTKKLDNTWFWPSFVVFCQ